MSLTNFLQKPLAKALSGALAAIAAGGLWAGGLNYHYAQDTFDADASPNKVLVTAANAAALGLSNSQGGSVGMTVMSQTGVLSTLAVGAMPFTFDRGASANLNANADAITTANYNKSDALDTLALDGLTFNGFATSVQTAGATNTNHGISNDKNGGFTVVSGNSYCVSVLIPAGQAQRYAQLMYFGGFFGTNAWANFDLQAGTVGSVGSAATAGVIPVPGGYRVWMSAPATGSGSTAASALNIVTTGAAARNQAYAGTGQALRFTAYQVNPGVAPTAILRTFATAPLYTAGTPRSQNRLQYSADLSGWSTGPCTAVATATTLPDGRSGNCYRVTATGANADFYRSIGPTLGTVDNCVYTNKIYIRRVSGSGTVQIITPGNLRTTVAITSSWQQFSASDNAAPGPNCYVGVRVVTSGDVIEVAFPQNTEGTADLAYYETTGTAYSEYPQAGLLLDSVGSTRETLQPRDLTNAAWTKANVTATKNQTGLDGVASSCTSLTATAGSYTAIVTQAVISASANRAFSIRVRALSANPVIQLSCDGGVTATPDITVGPAWQEIATTKASVTNPSYKIYLKNSGDSIAVDFVQGEKNDVATPPIWGDESIAQTRAATAIRPPSTWVTDGPQTVAMTVVPSKVATGASQVLLARSGSSNGALYLSATGAARCWDGTNVATSANTASDGVPVTLASRWSGSGIGVCMNGGAIATASFDGSMGSAAPVGFGDDPVNGLGFRGLVKTFKSAPTAMNDTNFQLAAAGG